MIFQWENTIALAAVRDEQHETPFSLPGEGLWVCVLSSGSCVLSSDAAQKVSAGMLILGRGPLALIPSEPCHVLAVLLVGHAPAELLAGLPHTPFVARGETCPAAAELLGQLAEEADDKTGRAASQLAFSLLCELSTADAAMPALPPLVAQALSDIRRNYAGLYGVEELSEQLGVSKSHLVRTFTAAVGVSPGKYLTGVRIEAAKRLLLHREYSLEVVATLCGYSGANYLCRVFRRETGCTPAQWRTLAARQNAVGLTPDESRRELELYV